MIRNTKICLNRIIITILKEKGYDCGVETETDVLSTNTAHLCTMSLTTRRNDFNEMIKMFQLTVISHARYKVRRRKFEFLEKIFIFFQNILFDIIFKFNVLKQRAEFKIITHVLSKV